MIVPFRLIFLIAFVATGFTGGSLSMASLIVNGSFEQTDKRNFPDRWKFGDPAKNRIETEDGQKFLRIELNTPNAAITSQKVAIDPSYASVTVKLKMRAGGLKVGAEAWNTGRVQLLFLDKNSEKAGDWNAINLAKDQPWTEHTSTLDVPKNAVALEVACGIWGASGTVDFDEVSVIAKPKELPIGQRLDWKSIVTEVTRTRGTIDLSGEWLFKLADGDSVNSPAGAWGVRSVPASIPAPTQRMWYERDVHIPQEWADRRIELELRRVSTDAKLWVNGQPAGNYAWPGGTTDITKLVKTGELNTLRLLVISVDDRTEVEVLMGYATNTKEKAELKTRGLIGPVALHSSPAGARATDVLLRAVVSDKTLLVDLESDRAVPQETSVVATPVGGGDAVTLMRVGEITSAADGRTHTATFQWPDVKLWDVGQPNLYRVLIDVKGTDGLDDQISVPTFGFREFRLDGRQFLLNGTRIHLRPALLGQSGAGLGSDVKALLKRGFNFGEIWPEDQSRRGTPVNDDALIAEADAAGLLVTGNALHMRDFVTDIAKWDLPATRAEYARQMEPLVRRWRNHPSVVMWDTSGNLFQSQADGAPETLGKRDFISQQEYSDLAKRAQTLISMVKALDPTRPLFTHFGTYIGDVYTSNLYLNFIPLQEREEWMTEWSKNGQMPFMAVEFGVPFWSTWTRGRAGFAQSGHAEVFLTEWAARYLGKRAYTLEPPAFRALLSERFIGGTDRLREYDKVWWWDKKHLIFTRSESFQRVQDLYVTNTWRAWRTLGISGGMIPWDNGMEAPSLESVNGPTLAWIAGPETALLAKDHHFYAGSTVEKQGVLINDLRSPQQYEVKWEASVGQTVVGGDAVAGTVGVGDIVKLPIRFVAGPHGSGRITLTARIGDNIHKDQFDFNVFAAEPKSAGEIITFDPRGETTQLLQNLGYSIRSWTGDSLTSDQTLVIGQRALSGDGRTGQRDLPRDLAPFIQAGGRVLVMAQDPAWMRHAWQLRVANHVARRAYAIDASHPVLAGLDDEALRDWNGAGSLIDGNPRYPGYEWTLQYGWRNGNRGSITSAAIEKPHRSSLRPILECEFDLAYSPLMEMEFGAGRVTFCTLDIESRGEADPAAIKLIRQLLEHVRTAPIVAKAKRVTYVGDDAGAATLKELGLRFERPAPPDASPAALGDLIIIGGGQIDEAAIRERAEAGCRIVVLRRTDPAPILGATFTRVEAFHGSTATPAWTEAAGLSASDLHYRADTAAWLVQPSAVIDVAADGMLARATIGKSNVLFVQASPDAVPADEKRYLRFTRWRQTRVLSQVLANAGATFEQDDRLLQLLHEPDHAWMLAGAWNANLTAAQPESPRRVWRTDPGTSEAAKSLIASGDLGNGQTVPVPAYMESYGPEWRWVDGEVVFRKQINLPARLAGRDMFWSLGRVDEKETSYVNGKEIGSSAHWLLGRGHKVPATVFKAGENTLAVRVFDTGIHGGLCGDPSHLYVRVLPKTRVAFYHEDYIDDGVDESATDVAGWQRAAAARSIADNPYRYYRW